LAIESIETPLGQEFQPGELLQGSVLNVRGRLLRPSYEVFPRWLATLHDLGYTPVLRAQENGAPNEVILRIFPGTPRRTRPKIWINLLLFVLTVISTLYVGTIYQYLGDPQDFPGIRSEWDFLLPRYLINGWPFSATILAILVAHEFGHYFAARYHKVRVSLPFFIPLPIGLGTMGAVIVQRELPSDRRKIFDIGVAGPLAGLALAVPLLILGLATSNLGELPTTPGIELEGNSILYYAAKFLVFGQTLPNFTTGVDVYLNQIAWAAWAGLYVTFLNLLPVGQLDGGHAVYALFGRHARYINIVTLMIMSVLAVAGLPFLQEIFPALRSVGFLGWFVWLGLINFLIGPYHPPALDDVTQLDVGRRWVGYFVILCLILTALPAPIYPIN
jgi:membrane-associated protease RseP (regulator of RpoE activity)